MDLPMLNIKHIKMKIRIVKRNETHMVEFNQRNQYFVLAYEGSKKECRWYRKMLKRCFKNFLEDENRKG
jgi:hypothetical protein